jgi:hypothetical protein
MGCPDRGRLAAAVSGDDADAANHAYGCERCGPVVDEMRGTIAVLAALAPPRLSAERRAALADAVVVEMQAREPAPLRRLAPAIGGMLAAAAVVIVVAAAMASGDDAPSTPKTVEVTPPPTPPPAPVAPPPAPTPSPSITADGTSDHVVERAADRDTVRLRDGAVAIDAPAATNVDVVVGTTTVAVTGARATIKSKRGVLSSVQVFAGSVEVTTSTGKRAVTAGEIWVPPPVTAAVDRPPASDTPAPPATAGVEWFRRGWLALRAGDHAAAIDAFDRADDPAVAEDAAFWAAIACERAGKLDEAHTRLERFLVDFPRSVRVAAARTALDRIAPPP